MVDSALVATVAVGAESDWLDRFDVHPDARGIVALESK
jgi:hypothetical protein